MFFQQEKGIVTVKMIAAHELLSLQFSGCGIFRFSQHRQQLHQFYLMIQRV